MSLNSYPYAGLHYSERNDLHKYIFEERIKFLIKAEVLKNKTESLNIEQVILENGGATTTGYKYLNYGYTGKIGVMIAGNSGLPWGGCGKSEHNTYEPDIKGLKKDSKTQEESIVSNWIKTTLGIPYNNLKKLDSKVQDVKRIYKDTTKGRWGMEELNNTSIRTIQGIDYTTNKDPLSYSDAWVVSNCKLSESGYRNEKVVYKGPSNSYIANLVFVAGPNYAATSNNEKGTMNRTLNNNLSYNEFKECVKQALKAGLKAMILSNIKVAILAKVSGGIYAGQKGSVYRTKINNDYNKIITELLNERLISGSNLKYSDYFKKVFI